MARLFTPHVCIFVQNTRKGIAGALATDFNKTSLLLLGLLGRLTFLSLSLLMYFSLCFR